jgi:hypothetical protein
MGTSLIWPTSKLGSTMGSVIDGGATNASCAKSDALQLSMIAKEVAASLFLLFIANPIIVLVYLADTYAGSVPQNKPAANTRPVTKPRGSDTEFVSATNICDKVSFSPRDLFNESSKN